ncbi:hypothetical protein [Escherichia coli]|uniref:hypothetical protein n=1 Tax=Escherichia coli TaxID=562 RepID=UPI000A4183AB|nr:hypothetical protein [Escherichia coli]
MPSGVAWAQPCAALYADQVYSKELYIRHIDAFIAVGARPAALFTLISCDSTRQIM